MTERLPDPRITAARSGDREALEALLEDHEPQIYRFGMKMCRDPEDARDVLQETLLAVARNIGSYREDSSFSTWLYSIARSFCIKQRRTSKFAPAKGAEVEVGSVAGQVADPGQPPDEHLARKQLEAALERAIAGLDPMYREVLVLRDLEGLSAAETAEVLGLGVPAIKSRLHRARLAVRDQLAPLLQPAAQAEACPDILARYSEREAGELDAQRCAEIERHLAGCTACRGACEALRQTLVLCREVGADVEVPETVRAAVRAALRAASG